ncbi:anti-sigma factor family protein [Pedobacter mendelii]|uniref:Uncharacterized protein n=1 Tax=Pedobacter mendelii TaxID=1908240 RepID=A0ABQ2BIT0_9SPHI|nr:hypothetical protein [Pedobacter mendelii]GGI26761.1 hypothetical protein GCM10008119_24280 [Pedobacter mendelii]
MNTIEQQLWDYIDGNLNETQRKNIEEKIEKDAEVKLQYEELLNLNSVFSEMEIDEPSMSFTRNVMDSVTLEPAPVSLKTKVDNRIIYGIGGFFVASLLALLSYVFYNSTFIMPDFSRYMSVSFEIDKVITPTSLYIFLGIDLVLGLIYIDYFLRKKLNHNK